MAFEKFIFGEKCVGKSVQPPRPFPAGNLPKPCRLDNDRSVTKVSVRGKPKLKLVNNEDIKERHACVRLNGWIFRYADDLHSKNFLCFDRIVLAQSVLYDIICYIVFIFASVPSVIA